MKEIGPDLSLYKNLNENPDKMGSFVKFWKQSSIVDVWKGSEYAYEWINKSSSGSRIIFLIKEKLGFPFLYHLKMPQVLP